MLMVRETNGYRQEIQFGIVKDLKEAGNTPPISTFGKQGYFMGIWADELSEKDDAAAAALFEWAREALEAMDTAKNSFARFFINEFKDRKLYF